MIDLVVSTQCNVTIGQTDRLTGKQTCHNNKNRCVRCIATCEVNKLLKLIHSF